MRKKILSLFFALATSVGMMWAQGPWTSGDCTLTLSEGVMTVSGNGAMADYNTSNPWKSYNSSITSIVIEDGVTHVGNGTFPQCTSLVSVVIGDDVETIGEFTFDDAGASLISVTMGNKVKSIGMAAFLWDTGLPELILSENLETIGDYAFCRMEALTTITIPSKVTSIGAAAFSNCSALQSIYIEATTPPTLGDGVFANVNADLSTIPLYVPNGSVAAYQAAAQWNAFNIQAIPAPYAVEFALGDAEGTAPAAVDVTIGEHITMPVNKTMYKAGYTLTGWSDGVNTYPIGESFTPANDVVLTPVFTANEADLLNASSNVTVKWYFGGDNGAPTTSYEGTSGLLVAQATIGDKKVDVKLSIDATSDKFAPQATTEWAQVNKGTIFTYPYKEGMTVNVDNYKSYVTYYIADAEGKVVCYYENDYYSFIEVTYPASQPTAVENVQTNHVQATKFFRDGQLLIEKNGHIINVQGQPVR